MSSYFVCDLNLLLDFKYFLFVIELSFDTLSNFIEKKGWLNKPYYLINSSYTMELQGNSKLKVALTKYLEEKEYLEKTIKSRLLDVSSGEVLLQTKLIRLDNSFY